MARQQVFQSASEDENKPTVGLGFRSARVLAGPRYRIRVEP